MKFRKKPVVVEAVQYFLGREIEGICWIDWHKNVEYPVPHIHTLEGIQHVSEGDWIITGVKGEKYPCKPDIFDLTYDPVH